MSNDEFIQVQVCYALVDHQEIITVSLPQNSDVQHAIDKSNILEKFPEIELTQNNVGIFGTIVSLSKKLSDQDRIEIYRPLQLDPMQARRKRAESHRRKFGKI